MTQYEGIRTASLRELENGLHTLVDQMKADAVFSPLWKASQYWLTRTYGEIRRRQDEAMTEWGNGFDFMGRDYGDEA